MVTKISKTYVVFYASTVKSVQLGYSRQLGYVNKLYIINLWVSLQAFHILSVFTICQ